MRRNREKTFKMSPEIAVRGIWVQKSSFDQMRSSEVNSKALDLFCGTKSVTRTLEGLGYEVVTLDIRRECQADFVVDIRKWPYWKFYDPGYFDIIWASIPCTEFSQALTTRERNLRMADSIARRTLNIIRWLSPKKFFIENPAGHALLQNRPYMRGVPKIAVDYCQFQPLWGYKKPTHIFGSVENLSDQVCNPQTCQAMLPGGKRHKIWLGAYGSPISRNMKFRVPQKLVEYVCTGKKSEPEPQSHCQGDVQSDVVNLSQPVVVRNPVMSLNPQTKIQTRLLRGYQEGEIGRVQVEGDETQLLLRVDATTPDGKTRQLLALVDTGAQVNLFRIGLFASEEVVPAKCPIGLVTVDGTRLNGGDRQISLTLGFSASAGSRVKDWRERAIFIEGDIQVDLILGYPWLRSTHLGILPHKDALFREGSPTWLLRSVTSSASFPETIDTAPQKSERLSRARIQQMRLEKSAQEWEDFEKRLIEICKLQLTVPGDTEIRDMKLSRKSNVQILQKFEKVNAAEIARVITTEKSETEWGEHQPLVDELRDKLHKDYDGVVLCDEALPDPPDRGPHCTARIFLKPGAEPKKQKQIFLQGERREAVQEIAGNWLKGKRTESCEGPWSSPSFPVRKKNNKWRGVVDLRWMNSQCMDDAYPLPRIHDILVRMGRKKIFSIMDLKDAFHQIPLEPESRPITGTSTPLGLQQWRVVVMGWKNGVQYCQRNVETVLEPVSDIAAGYVDDILAGTDDDDEVNGSIPNLLRKHDQEIRRVLDTMQRGKLVADRKKMYVLFERGYLLRARVEK